MELVAYARVCWGRWVADCPRPGCSQAEHFGADPMSGHIGGLSGQAFRCGTEGVTCGCGRAVPSGCGLVCRVVWPENIAGIERLLMLRPVPQNRNWSPGEELADLMVENTAMGISPVAPDQIEAGHPGGPLLRVVGNEIVTDVARLDSYAARRALGRA